MCAAVVTLSVGTGGVDNAEEMAQQVGEADFVGIKNNFNGFGVSRAASANFFVAWVFGIAVGIACLGGKYAVDALEIGFNSSKAAACKINGLWIRHGYSQKKQEETKLILILQSIIICKKINFYVLSTLPTAKQSRNHAIMQVETGCCAYFGSGLCSFLCLSCLEREAFFYAPILWFFFIFQAAWKKQIRGNSETAVE